MIQIADRMKAIQPSVFSELLEEKEKYEKRTGKEVIDFSLGSPTIPPAKQIIETMVNACSDPANYRYAVVPLPSLISEIQTWYKERYNTELAREQITLLQGSQEALVNLPLIYCNPGDGILVPDPYYPVYTDAPKLAGAEIFYMPLKEENGYLIDLDAIPEEQRKRAKMMIVCYPNNPTGATADSAFIKKLIRFGLDNEILIVYDNAYSDLIYSGEPGFSFLSFPDADKTGVEINSFSKSYGMAGARLGVLLGNPDVIHDYSVLKSNMDYGVFLPVQYAGITALDSGYELVKQTNDKYRNRRDLTVQLFREAGWNVPSPEATMFIWARIPEKYKSSEEFARELLRQTGVMVTPGDAFGPMGEGYVRLAFVLSEEKIREAASRIEKSGFFRSERNC